MIIHSTLVLSAILTAAWSAEDLAFPPGFKFGVASAAYQVEGAWNVSDKGESIWDRFTHSTPSLIANSSTGDVACDSYHKWKEDIELVAEVGAQFYRISVSWARLLPNGFPDRISEDGKTYYNKLIDGLLEKGIEPVVTLYHWDLPQRLQDLGGWTNPLIVDWFADYSRVVYSLYGDRVKTWITINEAWAVCDFPYFTGYLAPGIVSTMGAYICTKNVLMAHAKAWRIYDEEFKPKFHGQVSLANHLMWMEAANASEESTAELLREYQTGRFSHPIYSKEGGWPPAIEKALADFSAKEGYPRSMLPNLTKEEIVFMKGTFDFYAVNFYNSRLIHRARAGEDLQPWPTDAPLFNAKMEIHPNWTASIPFFTIHPEGFRKQLSWLKKHYGDIPFLITENGLGNRGGLNDIDRMQYFRDYLKQVLLAIKEDGVNVTAYTAWTIMDNFEWVSGYNTKFGLYEVDFSSPLRTRTPRASAKYYASVVETHSLDVPILPYNLTANVATKSSSPQDSKTHYIIFGGLVMVIVVGIIAALVGWRVKLRARKEKRKRRYTAVKNGDYKLVAQNEVVDEQNGSQVAASNGTQNDPSNGTQNSASNGTQNGNSNGTQNGNSDSTPNGRNVKENGS